MESSNVRILCIELSGIALEEIFFEKNDIDDILPDESSSRISYNELPVDP